MVPLDSRVANAYIFSELISGTIDANDEISTTDLMLTQWFVRSSRLSKKNQGCSSKDRCERDSTYVSRLQQKVYDRLAWRKGKRVTVIEWREVRRVLTARCSRLCIEKPGGYLVEVSACHWHTSGCKRVTCWQDTRYDRSRYCSTEGIWKQQGPARHQSTLNGANMNRSSS